MEGGATKRKNTRTHLTLQQKAQLRTFLAANPKLPQFAVADWVREQFHVRLGRTTLYRVQSAPESAFTTGNLSRKKLRRVKFPDFERQLLAFYEERREQREDVPDDVLLRKAAECRAACGISDVELKLSNGWLYRFKIRHQLNSTPPQPRQLEPSREEGGSCVAELGLEPSFNSTGLEGVNTLTAVCEAGTLSARALTTVPAPGFLNWEPIGEMQQEGFAVVADGVLVLQPGEYELSVRVQHTAPLPITATDCIFKVYCGSRVLGQCGAPERVHSNVASSALENSDLFLEAQTVLKVEFLAPGYAFTESSIVLRRKTQ